MADIDRRRFVMGAAALAFLPRVSLSRGDIALPRAYTPEDARPYYHPIYELKEEHVDPLIWPAVHRINQSGWVWTLESCEGHQSGEDRELGSGWSEWPMLRLAVHHGMAGRMFGLLHRAVPISKNQEGALRLVTWRHVAPPMKGWFECRVSVTGAGDTNEQDRNAGRRAFELFGKMANR